MKVDEFIDDIKQGRTFGAICAGEPSYRLSVSVPLQRSVLPCLMRTLVCAVLYTVEFQKRGLPHIHCLVWLANSNPEFSASAIDAFISAEIPDRDADPLGYALVEEFMIHGPCGDANKNFPCMKDDRCSKNFPKSFQDETIVDEFGFTIYKRRNDGRHVLKNGVKLDNRMWCLTA
jgi:hypothetical protein